ncbi:MAG: hypothetical protein L0216_05755 [Planctomycetales bacterium]|nr:hypothetical protein [Planctomycetales bacterium]
MKHLWYQTDAEGLVVVVDSNGSPVHQHGTGTPCASGPRCRLCQLEEIEGRVRGQLAMVPGRGALRVAIGIAVPAIEAWYLCGADPRVNEAAWVNGQRSGSEPYSRPELKKRTYGAAHPSPNLETTLAVRESSRVARTLPLLRSNFPVGFGALQDALMRW